MLFSIFDVLRIFKALQISSDCNWTRTQNHLFRKRTLNHSGNYRVWIHSEMRTWHDKNIESANILLQILLKMGKKWRRFWVQHILWSSKILFVFESRLKFFFQMVIFAMLFRHCPTLWKSTFNSTLKYTTLL